MAVSIHVSPLALLLVLWALGGWELHLLPHGSLGSYHQLAPTPVLVGGNGGAGIMSLRHMQGDKPVSLVCNDLHVSGVVLGQQHADLLGKTLQEEVGEDSGGRLAAGQNSSISANITDGLRSPRGRSFIIHSIFL
jgi:hypothetical protein